MFLFLPAAMTFIFALYIYSRVVVPFVSPMTLKIFFLAILLICSQLISITRILAEGRELSILSVRISSVVTLGIMVFTVLLFLRDLTLVFTYLLQKISHLDLSSFLSLLTGQSSIMMLFLLTGIFLVAGVYPAIKVPDVKEVSITIPNLPKDLQGIKLVQLSDLHIGSGFSREWLQKVVAKVNTLNADYVLVTGDLVDGTVAQLGNELNSLTELKSTYGTILITGNHEYYSGLLPWVSKFREMGLQFLLNQNRVDTIGEAKLAFIGVADSGHGHYAHNLPPDHEQALQGVPDDAVKILLAHQPKEAKQNAKYGYSLQLAGHTHGGQIFLIFPIVDKLNDGYRSGLYDVGNMQLYVSNGTGLWGYAPLRIGAPSEITLITLE